MRLLKLYITALVVITGLMVSTPGYAQQWTGIIAPSRATNWSNAGVLGGIPSGSWKQCATAACTALATPSNVTAANINTAIAGAPANTYVLLPAGSFTISTGVIFNVKNNVELRGAGANQTLLTFTGSAGCQGLASNICFESGDTDYYGAPSNVANWTTGYAAGSQTITLDSTANLAVGHAIILDQTDDPSTSDTGAIFVCYTPQGTCSTNGDNGGDPRANRSQEQMVTVTNINGNQIGISPPIVMPNWVSSKTPQAWWATSPILGSGVRDLSITTGSSGAANIIAIFNCVGCWVRGIRSVGPPGRSHISIYQSNHITVQDSYFYNTSDSASVNYGIEVFGSDDLIQNNIFEQTQAPYPTNGPATGNVYAYNFDVNNVFSGGTWLNQSGFPHAVGDEHLLYEGNIGAGIYSDNFHGTHQFQTIFRNYYNGYQKNEGKLTTNSLYPLIINAFSRFYNVIGNVLGNPAGQTIYEDTVSDPHSGAFAIFSVGYGDEIPNDSNTVTTLLRWGNYDIINNAVRFVSGEVPSGLTGAQAPFANPVPANNNLPPSFYLTSKPSWWTSGKPWPSIGPDVTGGDVMYCVGGTYTGTYVLSSGQCPGGTTTTLASGHIISNPAMDCYLNSMAGPPDGTGSVLSFNANTCYASGSAQAPAPPTNLKAMVQ